MTTTQTPVPLFREKVFRKSDKSIFGGVILPNPAIISILSVVSVALVLLLVYVVCTVEYTKRITATGWLIGEPGVAEITASHAGNIDRLFVKEGGSVFAGGDLFSVNQSTFTESGVNLNAAAHEALQKERQFIESRIQFEKENLRHELGSLKNQRELVVSSLNSNKALLEKAQQKIRLSVSEYERMKSFYQSGHLPRRDLELVEKNLVSEQIDSDKNAQAIVELEYKVLGIDIDVAALPGRYKKNIDELNALRSDVKKREIESLARTQTVIKAPIDGSVTGIIVNVGDSVTAGQRILSIVPNDSKLVGEIFLPTDSAAMVKIGTTVDVRYDSLPIQQYGSHEAIITSIEKRPLLHEQQLLFKSTTPLYRAVLSIDGGVKSRGGQGLQLKQGMTLSANIRVHKRRIVDWVLDPTYELFERQP